MVERKNRKESRNKKIMAKYHDIQKRMGDVKFLTPHYEIMEEIAEYFAIEPTTVSRIITAELTK